MKPLVIGTREDVAGLALAGVEGRVCTTAAETRKAVDAAGDALLILSAEAAAHVAERIAAWSHSGSGPMFVVLPRR